MGPVESNMFRRSRKVQEPSQQTRLQPVAPDASVFVGVNVVRASVAVLAAAWQL